MGIYSTVEYKVSDSIATVTLNRPDIHNAFNETTIAELIAAFDQANNDSNIRVVILNANGRHFCAGADLNWMQQMAKNSTAENMADALELTKLLQLMANLSKPIIGLIHGRVMGGGCGLVACCDVVLAADNSQFCFSEVKLGLIPATIAPYIVRRLGYSTALRFFISAELITAQQAITIHLIDEIKTMDALLPSGLGLANALLQNGPQAIDRVKKLLNQLYPINAKMIEITANALADVRASAEAQSGLKAFFEKQKPNFAKDL